MTPDQLRAICDEHAIVVSITGFVRESDASKLLEVSVRTLRSRRQDGIAPLAVRIAGTWRYSLDELAAALTPAAEFGNVRQSSAKNDSDDIVIEHDDAASLQ